MTRLREELPTVPLRASGARGTSYVEAYEAMARENLRGRRLIDLPAPATELVLARPCDTCLAAPATAAGVVIIHGEPAKNLCPDCLRRHREAGGTKGDRRTTGPERRMTAALAAAGHEGVVFPDHFFAQVTDRSDTRSDVSQAGTEAHPTQLAAIYADGNAVGAFLEKAAEHARRTGRPRKDQIVAAVESATLSALAEAVARTYLAEPGQCLDPSRPPVLTHLAGGDDLLLTVPAAQGWPFARILTQVFGDRMCEAAADWKIPDAAPTLSVGLVFHHYAHPFSDVTSTAFGELKWAKRALVGQGAGIAFLDLTADGADRPPYRRACPVEWLGRRARVLNGLAATPAAYRATLVDQHRQCDSGAPQREAEHDGAEAPEQALARRALDRGDPAVRAAAALACDVEISDVEGMRARLTDDPRARDELRLLLDIARWWPAEKGDE